MTDGHVTTLPAPTTEPELKTETWRVLKRDEDTVPSVVRWTELEPLTGEGQYGYYVSAEILGEEYGEGDYILIKDGPLSTCRTVSVVAARYYSFGSDE